MNSVCQWTIIPLALPGNLKDSPAADLSNSVMKLTKGDDQKPFVQAQMFMSHTMQVWVKSEVFQNPIQVLNL